MSDGYQDRLATGQSLSTVSDLRSKGSLLCGKGMFILAVSRIAEWQGTAEPDRDWPVSTTLQGGMMMNSSKLFVRKGIFVAVSALALGASGAAFAGTDTASLGVSATVSDNCEISTAALGFGSYDPIVAHAASSLDATGTVTVTCTTGAAATVLLGQGANSDTGSTDAAPVRRMNDGGLNHLSYSLFSDSGRTAVWGNDPTVDVDHTGTGGAVGLTVYGRVAAAQNVPAGSYSDTVVATVSF